MLAESALLAQLDELDLSKGILTDAGAQVIVDHANAFAHLRSLDLSENYLSEAGAKLVKKLGKHVDVSDQKDDDDPEYRYVTVGE